MDDSIFIRQTPHSVEAEQAVLGSIVIDPSCVPLMLEMLNPEDFYIENHRVNSLAIKHYKQYGKPTNLNPFCQFTIIVTHYSLKLYKYSL